MKIKRSKLRKIIQEVIGDSYGYDENDIIGMLERNPWSLYSPETPEEAQEMQVATDDLNAALEQAKESVRDGMDVWTALEKHINPVRDRYASLGAADTEGRVYAIMELEKLTGNSWDNSIQSIMK
tara:strand:- start:3139 stop:3513 length:375 start_codon:yes stop_codon:yes gene_type:complete